MFELVIRVLIDKMANEMSFKNRSINADLWTDCDENIPCNTPMRDFYRGKNIFVTGGTGFLGQLYVQKLLRLMTFLCIYANITNFYKSFNLQM